MLIKMFSLEMLCVFILSIVLTYLLRNTKLSLLSGDAEFRGFERFFSFILTFGVVLNAGCLLVLLTK